MADFKRILRIILALTSTCVPGLYVTAYVLHIIAINTNFWSKQLDNGLPGHSGLWAVCKDNEKGESSCTNILTGRLPVWFVVVVLLESIGLLGLVAASLLVLLDVCRNRKDRNKIVLFVTLLTGMCILTGITMYAVNTTDSYLGYSFYFSSLAGCISLLLTIFLCYKLCEQSRAPRSRTNGQPDQARGQTRARRAERHRGPVGFFSRLVVP